MTKPNTIIFLNKPHDIFPLSTTEHILKVDIFNRMINKRRSKKNYLKFLSIKVKCIKTDPRGIVL